ncbi:MAG: 4'-phosphopantetheinyl transferase superfamily protein, partial [Chrysiogenales bacterium]
GDPLEILRARCRDLCVIELGTIVKPWEWILSEEERKRFTVMREKRGTSFLGARMALKTIARRMPGGDPAAAPRTLTTMHPDGRPRCPLPDGIEPFHCTASHDSRFAVSAVSESRIGIDVEEITGRVLKGRRLYMHEEELALASNHPLGETEASTRIWSIKEAVSKAAVSSLPGTWQGVAVREIGNDASRYEFDGETREAFHAVVEGHLFTLCIL